MPDKIEQLSKLNRQLELKTRDLKLQLAEEMRFNVNLAVEFEKVLVENAKLKEQVSKVVDDVEKDKDTVLVTDIEKV